MISGVGLYAPARKVDNQFFNELYERDLDSFLREQRNIYSRHFMDESECTSDLIVPAAEQAIASAGITAADIDLVIVATDTPDYVSPSTAAVVQYRLGAESAGVFDLNSACAGFCTALDVAWKYIRADQHYQNILVVGAYGMSKYFDWDDYKVTSVFADGAGAVVVSESENSGILESVLYADGQYHDYMGIYAGGTKTPITESVVENQEHKLQFCKKIPVDTNSNHWPRLTQILSDRIGKSVEEIKHFFLTQINVNSIHESLDKLDQPRAKAHTIMDRFGYTGSACIPMALADAARQSKLKKGDLVVMLGSGGGMSMAALAVEWGYDT